MMVRQGTTMHLTLENTLMIFDYEVFQAAVERGKAFKRARSLWDRQQRAQATADKKRAHATGVEP